MKTAFALGFLLGGSLLMAQEKAPAFREQTIDDKIEIGYAVTVADVDGDGKPDILVVDKKQIVWYHNPDWTKHVIAENLTEHDNVCIAAQDIDGSGKCSIAVGAEWNPSDTVNSGAVFYLIPPADRTQKWEPVRFPSVEPTTHRMKWVRRGTSDDGKPRHDLLVVPLHGRGNKNGEGAGVKVLEYQMPKDPHDVWKSYVVSDDMHMMHNFAVVSPPNFPVDILHLGGREGIKTTGSAQDMSHAKLFVDHRASEPPLSGVGEVRVGLLQKDRPFLATVEPMHGNMVAIYFENKGGTPPRTLLDDTLVEGHALACGDLLHLGRDQIVVGWRGKTNDRLGKVGIKMFVPDEKGEHWTQHLLDDNTMACEDLVLADLNGDGKLDIIASGRRTKNVKIYWNETK